jgi:RNA polymerase sigma-70 factor (ECF subfamily)
MYPGRTAGRTQVATHESEPYSDGHEADRRAVVAVLAGERAAYRALVERHHRGVHALMQRMVHHTADADDLAQQAFIAAFAALGSFHLEQRFSTWIYRIAINLAKDHLKSKKRTEVGLPDEEPAAGAFSGHIAAPDASLAEQQRQRLLRAALARLTVDDREILVLKDIEELSFAEIKEITGRPITALKIRAVRARGRLKAALAALGHEEAP